MIPEYLPKCQYPCFNWLNTHADTTLVRPLQDAIEDLYLPMQDLHASMTLQQQQSAGSLTKLIVMIHTHNRLLSKYGNELYSVIMFHTCCDRVMFKEFR